MKEGNESRGVTPDAHRGFIGHTESTAGHIHSGDQDNPPERSGEIPVFTQKESNPEDIAGGKHDMRSKTDIYGPDIVAKRAEAKKITEIADELPEEVSPGSVSRIIADLRAEGHDVPTTPGRGYSNKAHEETGGVKLYSWQVRSEV
jgi:hypothetical protein